jgi:glycosyltransferase involved in cell wall biosynthesis
VGFDVAHHVTIVSFQYPSCLAWLPCPFIWGPVGGCLRAPLVFYPTFGPRGVVQELSRDAFNLVVRYSPLVLWTIWRADRIVPTTEFSRRVLPRWAMSKTVLMRGEGVELGPEPPARPKRTRGVRFLYVGRLLHWKGVHLAIRAFADYLKTDSDGQFTIQMDGPYRPRLQRLAAQLGISDRVVFDLTSTIADVQGIYDTHDVFICPSLHDSGSFVTIEAMSRELPVVCFDRGGPAHSVTDAVGIRIATHSPAQAIADMAAALRRLGSDPELRTRMGRAGRHRAATQFSWDGKGTFMRDLYPAVQGESRPDWPINAESHA